WGPKAACQWSRLATGASDEAAERSCRAKNVSTSPTTMMPVINAGYPRFLRWPGARLTPACWTFLIFFADDALPIASTKLLAGARGIRTRRGVASAAGAAWAGGDELLEEPLVGGADGCGRHPALHEAAHRGAHLGAPVRIVEELFEGVEEVVRFLRRHRDARSGALHGVGHLGAGIDARQHRSARREDRVELGGDARPCQAPPEGHEVHVRGGEHLGEPFAGLHVDEPEVREPRRGPLQLLAGGAAAVDHEHHVVAVTEASGGLDHQVEGLRQAHVPRVHHDGAVAEAVLAAVLVLARRRPDAVGVDE